VKDHPNHRFSSLLPSFKRRIRARRARPLPLGVSVRHGGVRFSIFSQYANNLRLVLFADDQAATPERAFDLDPEFHRFGDIWSIFIEGIGAGQIYAWQAFGPFDPEKGHRFNDNKFLIDPYTRAIVGDYDWNVKGFRHDCPHDAPRSLVLDDTYPWKDNRFLRIPWEDTVIYEAHLSGFTKDESSGVPFRGTFDGFIEKLPYLRDLGITAVEVLPIQAFPAHENVNINPVTGARLTNYWGYSTLAFLAPHAVRHRPQPRLRGRGVQALRRRLPPARSRGHPGHRVQPHGRGGRDRPHPLVQGAGQPGLLSTRPGFIEV
jgi:glycogen operon protein